MQRFDTQRMWQRLMIVGMAIFLVAACSRSQTATNDMGMQDAQDESLAQNMDMDREDMHGETMNGEDMHDETMNGEDMHGETMNGEDMHGETMNGEDMHGETMNGEDMHDETMNSEDMHDETMNSEDMAAAHGIPDEAAARENPIPVDDASIARGAELFQTTCAVCHGPEGQGDGPGAAALNPKPANLSEDHVQGNSDGALFYTITNGVAGTAMVAWGQQYSEEDRWNLVNFLRTLPDHAE